MFGLRVIEFNLFKDSSLFLSDENVPAKVDWVNCRLLIVLRRDSIYFSLSNSSLLNLLLMSSISSSFPQFSFQNLNPSFFSLRCSYLISSVLFSTCYERYTTYSLSRAFFCLREKLSYSSSLITLLFRLKTTSSFFYWATSPSFSLSRCSIFILIVSISLVALSISYTLPFNSILVRLRVFYSF